MDLSDKIRLACIGLGLGVAAFACAAPTIPDESQDQDNTESGSTTKKNNNKDSGAKPPTSRKDGGAEQQGEGEPPPSNEGGAATPPPTTNCASSANIGACYQCCDPTKAVEPAIDAFGLCACQNPGTCAAQCGNNYCSGQQPTAACEACLNAATNCDAKAQAACGSACQAALKCIDTSKCDSKP